MNSRTSTVPFDRTAALQRLGDEAFDLLVIGGGITGAGVALDAASRGLKTALVEKEDFGAGTSSESSKLVHGGLRYLQQYEIGLVFQSLAERQILLANAPHLVEEQKFVIPLFGKGGAVDRARASTYSLGLWMYDLMGGFRIGHLHGRISADEVHAHLPTLRTDRLVAGFLYYDAHADDARLTLEIVRTAASYGAVAVNHAPVTALVKDAPGRVQGATVAPADSSRGPIAVQAEVVVSATGVWTDRIGELDGTATRVTRPAKGIHIAVPNTKLPCDAAVVLPSPRDRRTVFVIPWADKTYVGTTDTDYRGDLDDPGVSREDVDYLLEAVNAAVSEPLTVEDVTGTWSGLRPLLAPSPGRRRAPSERTADLSRRHRVMVSSSGLVTITGGKLTTYRKMAADTVRIVFRRLDRPRVRCRTKHLPLVGADNNAELRTPGAAARHGLDEERFEHLRSRYGNELGAVLALAAERPELGQPLASDLPFLGAEAVYAVRHEMATTIEDVLSRRMRVLFFDARAAAAAARPVAELIAPELGWDERRTEDEVTRFVALATAELDQISPALATTTRQDAR
jgi:glycerol-3-phosphate dehydrogenase